MIIDTNINYIQAYTEFSCLLEYLPQSYINKLPRKLIELIQKQSNVKYKINIDVSKSLLEQNFSNKTKDLIAVIKYNYWSTDEEKQKLKTIFYNNEDKYQKELLERNNPNDIFKNKEIKQELSETIDSNSQMVLYKENMFIRFFYKIKNIFIKKLNN